MKRIEALEAIYPELDRCVVVTIMGAVAAELQSIGHRPNFFYLQHAMGLASSMGLGIALSRPELSVIVLDGEAFAVRGEHLLRWAPEGYSQKKPRPRGIELDVLTPPSIVTVLKRGYAPVWHPSALR